MASRWNPHHAKAIYAQEPRQQIIHAPWEGGNAHTLSIIARVIKHQLVNWQLQYPKCTNSITCTVSIILSPHTYPNTAMVCKDSQTTTSLRSTRSAWLLPFFDWALYFVIWTLWFVILCLECGFLFLFCPVYAGCNRLTVACLLFPILPCNLDLSASVLIKPLCTCTCMTCHRFFLSVNVSLYCWSITLCSVYQILNFEKFSNWLISECKFDSECYRLCNIDDYVVSRS